MSAALILALSLADDIEKFPLGNCGSSDDPDKQTAYGYSLTFPLYCFDQIAGCFPKRTA